MIIVHNLNKNSKLRPWGIVTLSRDSEFDAVGDLRQRLNAELMIYTFQELSRIDNVS